MANSLTYANVSDTNDGDDLLSDLMTVLSDAKDLIHDANDASDPRRVSEFLRDIVSAKRALTNRIWELCAALDENRGRVSQLEDQVEDRLAALEALEAKVAADG